MAEWMRLAAALMLTLFLPRGLYLAREMPAQRALRIGFRPVESGDVEIAAAETGPEPSLSRHRLLTCVRDAPCLGFTRSHARGERAKLALPGARRNFRG